MRRINHSDAYGRGGAHTNLAESYLSRLRRMIGGRHLRVEGRYLDAHAAHAAWREDHRSESNGTLAERLIGGALAAPVSRTWKGYWQRRPNRSRVAGCPDAHALPLFHHAHELVALAWRSARTNLNTTEFRSAVCVISRWRSIILLAGRIGNHRLIIAPDKIACALDPPDGIVIDSTGAELCQRLDQMLGQRAGRSRRC